MPKEMQEARRTRARCNSLHPSSVSWSTKRRGDRTDAASPRPGRASPQPQVSCPHPSRLLVYEVSPQPQEHAAMTGRVAPTYRIAVARLAIGLVQGGALLFLHWADRAT